MSQLDLVTSQAPVITHHVMDICHFSDDDSLVISRNTTKFNVTGLGRSKGSITPIGSIDLCKLGGRSIPINKDQ